ncbi:uncharacterized protein [Musca autumnalis]|uniref:uncharacterized protein n=1 Tax=Musca autumnalis TaxID=221902 RepID=UPI003CED5FA0
MSLPPPPSKRHHHRRRCRRCKPFENVTTPIALTCCLLIAGVFVRNAQAGVIKKREIPLAMNMTGGMVMPTTATPPNTVLLSSIRANHNDPDIEVRELNQAPSMSLKLADQTPSTSTKLLMQPVESASHEQASQHNEIALNGKALGGEDTLLTNKLTNQSVANEENLNEAPHRAPLATENPILKLMDNLGEKMQGSNAHFLNDIISKELGQEDSTSSGLAGNDHSSLHGEATNTSSDLGNIMVLTPLAKEKMARDRDSAQEKVEGREPQLVAAKAANVPTREEGTATSSSPKSLQKDVEFISHSQNSRPILSVNITHENLESSLNFENTQESHKALGSLQEGSTTAMKKQVVLNGNFHDTQEILGMDNLNSQESQKPNGLSNGRQENLQESEVSKGTNDVVLSQNNGNTQESQSKTSQESPFDLKLSESAAHENSLKGKENLQGSQIILGKAIEEESQTVSGILQENTNGFQGMGNSLKDNENAVESQNVNKKASDPENNLKANENHLESQNGNTKSEKLFDSQIVEENAKASDIENTLKAHENHQESKNGNSESQNLAKSSKESQITMEDRQGNVQESQNANSKSHSIAESPKESQNTLESQQGTSHESKSGNSNSQNLQESEKMAATIQGNLHESQEGNTKSQSLAENPQESQTTDSVQQGNSQESTNQSNTDEKPTTHGNLLGSQNSNDKSQRLTGNPQEPQSAGPDDHGSTQESQNLLPNSKESPQPLEGKATGQKESLSASANSQESQKLVEISQNDIKNPESQKTSLRDSGIDQKESQSAYENPQESQNVDEASQNHPQSHLDSNGFGNAINDHSSKESGAPTSLKSSMENSLKETEPTSKNQGSEDKTIANLGFNGQKELRKSFRGLDEEDVHPGNHTLNEISSKETPTKSAEGVKDVAEQRGKLTESLKNRPLKNEEPKHFEEHSSSHDNNVGNVATLTAVNQNQTADLAKTQTINPDNSLETNHIQVELRGSLNENGKTVFSQAGGIKISNSSNALGIQDALDADSWKEVTNDLPDKTTEKILEENASQKPLDKLEYGRSMFGKDDDGENLESTTLPYAREPEHIANNIDFGENNSTLLRPKQPKFINENSSNALQMNLPNHAEVWSLAGMKNPQSQANVTKMEGSGASLHMQEGNMDVADVGMKTNSLNEKSLLDWSHIITQKVGMEETTEQYEEGIKSTLELLGNSSNTITANSTILSAAETNDKADKETEEQEAKNKGESHGSADGGNGGGGEESATETFVEFVASPKNVIGVTHERQQQPPDTNLTLTSQQQQQQNPNTTAGNESTEGVINNGIVTLAGEQSFINNITESSSESGNQPPAPVTTETAVMRESPTVQKTTVESSVNSFVQPSEENTTAVTVTTTSSSESELNLNFTETVKRENENRVDLEVTTYKPKFVIPATKTESSNAAESNTEPLTTTEKVRLAEVIDQNGNNADELQQKQSINIENTTTTTSPVSIETTTLAVQEPSDGVVVAVESTTSEGQQFSSSTIKTHLNEKQQQVLLANTTTSSTTTTESNQTTPTTTDIPLEATAAAAKENTTSSSIAEQINDKALEATTTPKPQQETKEGEAKQEEGIQEQITNTTATTEKVIIIGLETTTTPGAKEEQEKEELENKTGQEIDTTTTPTIGNETPVVEEVYTTTTAAILNENLDIITSTLSSQPNKETATTDKGEREVEDEVNITTTSTEKGVDTYFKFPLRGGGTQRPTATTTEEPEVEGSGGYEADIEHDNKGIIFTTTTIMSLPETTTITTTSTSAATEETFISLLDDSTTTTTSSTSTTTSIPIIIATATEEEASTSTTTLKGVEDIYKIITSSSTSTEASTSTTTEIPPTITTTTLKNYIENSTTTMIPPTSASPPNTTTMVIQTADIGGGAGGKSLPPLDTIMIGGGGGGDNNMFTKNTDASAGETDVNVIIAITVSVIGVIALILLVAFLYLMRKRQKQTSYSQRCRPVSLDEYAIDNGSIGGGSIRKGSAFRSSKRTYGNLAFDDPSIRHNAMGVHDLAKFASEKLRIFEEFRDVPQITARDDEVPPGCEDKNRYANVLPLPETRVILQRLNDDEKTEYINANYVSGPKDSPNYYIACQAPLESTVEDFWRMIWEQQSRVIIQATDLIENGIEKCAEYLPPSVTLDNHATFGDFQVTLQNREVKDKYAISTILLKNTAENNASRELTHYWYKWPETGVPTEEAPIIAMLLEARSSLISYAIEQANEDKEKSTTNTTTGTLRSAEEGTAATNGTSGNNKDGTNSNGSSNAEINGNISMVPIKKTARNQGPLTVHCSPGTGRTGTIIACDIAIRSLETPKRTVDIPHIVYYVRRGRASAVLTKEQYEFIYKVANMYAAKITNPSNYN